MEFALKACIAGHIAANTIPDKDFIRNVYSHDFRTLVGLAGLSGELKRTLATDASFAVNWAIVSEWMPESRYRSFTLFEAQTLIEAIENTSNGVFLWITRFW